MKVGVHGHADTGLQQPGQGSYLGNDPEGIHFISTPLHLPVMAHELGHLAEMGTYGWVQPLHHHHHVYHYFYCHSHHKVSSPVSML